MLLAITYILGIKNCGFVFQSNRKNEFTNRRVRSRTIHIEFFFLFTEWKQTSFSDTTNISIMYYYSMYLYNICYGGCIFVCPRSASLPSSPLLLIIARSQEARTYIINSFTWTSLSYCPPSSCPTYYHQSLCWSWDGFGFIS